MLPSLTPISICWALCEAPHSFSPYEGCCDCLTPSRIRRSGSAGISMRSVARLIQYQEAQPRLTELPTMDTNSNINKTRVRLYIFRYWAGPSRLLDWAGILGISFTLPMYPTLLCEHTSFLFTLWRDAAIFCRPEDLGQAPQLECQSDQRVA